MRIVIPAREGSKGLPHKNRKLFKYTADIIPEELRSKLIHPTPIEAKFGVTSANASLSCRRICDTKELRRLYRQNTIHRYSRENLLILTGEDIVGAISHYSDIPSIYETLPSPYFSLFEFSREDFDKSQRVFSQESF